ncbi:hypothetical protein MML48_9g00002322 [Holotrichia oblita]|uniref:Uncharacterized protein n=1 Tax=Holotrichia oblita TaxID=644536 RepID=A0ACB9STJ4_HOLOL|nr:hypothetical protein MML48_9g00002322 [Holotrichia oblita]
MSLSPNLTYNKAKDEVEGFEQIGEEHTMRIADHVQVFMLRGINRKWKQPIVYQFVHGGVKYINIVRTIKEIVRRTFNSGLHIVSTICDQGTNNQSAITYLINETRMAYQRRGENLHGNVFEVENHTIIPLYDPPHLIKCIRNNLLAKDITYISNNLKKVAKWSDIQTAFQLDSFSGELRVMPKLNEQHVNKDQMKKMKVALSTQVFSHTVSSAINLMAASGYSQGNLKLPKRATETAEFLKLFDTVFDSVNGYGNVNVHGKELRRSMDLTTQDCKHTKFWSNAIQITDTMRTVDINGKESTPPTFKNWACTLRNYILLKNMLKSNGVKVLNTRYINQDPLENFFGKIRQRGVRYTNPTCASFGAFYKSLLVNNLSSKHSVGSNCEDDNCNILITLQGTNTTTEEFSKIFHLPTSFDILKPIEENALAYVAGFISSKKIKLGKCIALAPIKKTNQTEKTKKSMSKGKKKLFQYKTENLTTALHQIRENKMKIREASRMYGVPKTTLIDRFSGRVPEKLRRPGPQPLLGMKISCNKNMLWDTVAQIDKDSGLNLFKGKRPGQTWYLSFLKRNPEISRSEAESVNKARAIVTKEFIQKWFTDLKQYLEEQKMMDIFEDPNRIFNGDESGFALCPKSGKVLGPRGFKNMYTVKLSNDKEIITVLIFFNANGSIAPPLAIFPYIRPPRSLINNLPNNWIVGKSEKGWMTSDVFYEYIANDFHTWVLENQIKKPLLIFVDGHKSHMTLSLSKCCKSYKSYKRQPDALWNKSECYIKRNNKSRRIDSKRRSSDKHQRREQNSIEAHSLAQLPPLEPTNDSHDTNYLEFIENAEVVFDFNDINDPPLLTSETTLNIINDIPDVTLGSTFTQSFIDGIMVIDAENSEIVDREKICQIGHQQLLQISDREKEGNCESISNAEYRDLIVDKENNANYNNNGRRNTDCNISDNSDETIHHKTSVLDRNTSSSLPDSVFDKHLIYPSTLTQRNRNTRNTKEKAPSAISSVKWREYYSRKDEEKELKEVEKEQRKIARDDKKKQKEMEKNKKKKRQKRHNSKKK